MQPPFPQDQAKIIQVCRPNGEIVPKDSTGSAGDSRRPEQSLHPPLAYTAVAVVGCPPLSHVNHGGYLGFPGQSVCYFTPQQFVCNPPSVSLPNPVQRPTCSSSSQLPPPSTSQLTRVQQVAQNPPVYSSNDQLPPPATSQLTRVQQVPQTPPVYSSNNQLLLSSTTGSIVTELMRVQPVLQIPPVSFAGSSSRTIPQNTVYACSQLPLPPTTQFAKAKHAPPPVPTPCTPQLVPPRRLLSPYTPLGMNNPAPVVVRRAFPKTSRSQHKPRFRGLTWHKRDKKWMVRFWSFGKVRNLGCYVDDELAALVYDVTAIQTFGEGTTRAVNLVSKERRLAVWSRVKHTRVDIIPPNIQQYFED
mmetsp:Transcript_11653/g.18631  ORF Transcript_11653/g.18631 Transcript_11653/m.18631 type:complete len:359 (-) Transcript_11653:184-1260(-)